MLNKNKDMPIEDFRKSGYELVNWIANYLEKVEEYPVVAQVNPGDIKNKLPKSPPLKSEKMSDVFADIDRIIMPGITHWNHPNFMAYFNATSSGPGILAELLIAGLNNNGMLWKTSPALTELEEVTLNWFREMIQLPKKFWGIIYDLASISSLHAIAAAREQAKEQNKNFNLAKLRIYTSEHAHSSIEKSVKTLGLSDSALVKIKVDNSFKIIPHELQKAIKEDLENDLQPFCIVATVGTTSTTSIDPIEEIVKINAKFNLWLHIDAAYAGTAAILPEHNYILNEVDKADSIVINPHKWLFVPIDLSILYT
ncbi:MAG: aminotransferase class I/II-fold pyridoxal phosphate-dependent enzyme, partial [Ignavibacteriae bacterium]|nr:aminotransferase class I/II-fold pyridoxal phosphate-dependent enzyme [Ignavibacteriota bacterium]